MRRQIIKLVSGDTERYYQGSHNGQKISPRFTDGYIYIDDVELDEAIEYLNSDKCIAQKAGFKVIVLLEVMLENRHRDWVDREYYKDIDALDDI